MIFYRYHYAVDGGEYIVYAPSRKAADKCVQDELGYMPEFVERNPW